MTHKLKFEMPYIDCDNFKEKDLLNFHRIISETRIGRLISNFGYGSLIFDENDKQHKQPIVTELDTFARSKTNCVVLNIKDNTKFDKLFIYQTLNKENPYYGIFGFNKNTNKFLHIYFLELDYSVLIINIYRILQNNKY